MPTSPGPTIGSMLNEKLTPQATVLASLMAVLWGGNNIAIKFSLHGLPPLALAGIRFILGVLVVLIWVYFSRVKLRLEPGERRGLFQLSALFLVQIYLLNAGVNLTLAGRSTILISTHPFFIAFFAHLMIPGDRLSRTKIAGMLFSFLGVVFIFAENLFLMEFQHILGDLTVLSSALLLGLRIVYLKRLSQGIHPAKLLVWQSWLSIPVFLLLSGIFEGGFAYHINFPILAGILYQGVMIAGIAFIINTTLIQRFIASLIGVYQFATPIFGVLFSNLLLGEGISIGLVFSMILVGAGIVIVNKAA